MQRGLGVPRKDKNAAADERAIAAWLQGESQPVGISIVTGTEPMTPADRRDSSDQLAIRQELLRQPVIQQRLGELAAQRDETNAGATYQREIEALSALLDKHLAPGELDAVIEQWLELGQFPLPSVVIRSGRPGLTRARRRNPETIALVARSLALRVKGAGRVRADQQVAPDFSSPDLVTKHRLHLARDSKAVQRWRTDGRG